MNPWMWLLFAVVATIVIFVLSAVFAGVWEGIRKPTPCPRCGHTPGTETGPWRKPS